MSHLHNTSDAGIMQVEHTADCFEALGLSATGKMTDADKVVNPEQTSGNEFRVIRKSALNCHITFG